MMLQHLFLGLAAVAGAGAAPSTTPGWSPNPSQVLTSRLATIPHIFACAATEWPPTTVGRINTPQAPSAELASMLSEISAANIEATVLKLVSFGTRHTLSAQNSSTRGIGAARDWIASEFRRHAAAGGDGRLGVEVVGYEQPPDGSRIPFAVRISDVVATLGGSEGGRRLYVVSGHYDSRVSDVMDYTSDAPGADDDASGVAVSLELARVMSQAKYSRPRAAIAFAAVAGEEQNLFGARFLAQTYANATPRANVEGMFTNDIIGSPKADDGTVDAHSVRLFAQGLPPLTVENATLRESRLTIGGDNDTPARNLARLVAEVADNALTAMRVRVIYRLDRYLRGGDHRPFLEAGYPAARFTEPNEDFAHQHQDVRVDGQTGKQYGDLPQFCDFEYIARVARVNAAALWSLANSPGVPLNVRVNSTTLTNDSTFYWDPPASSAASSPDCSVGGYEVVWRATDAPFWTHVVGVEGGAAARTATVDLSKDNVVFGVRAVSPDGYRGVAVLPFPVS